MLRLRPCLTRARWSDCLCVTAQTGQAGNDVQGCRLTEEKGHAYRAFMYGNFSHDVFLLILL